MADSTIELLLKRCRKILDEQGQVLFDCTTDSDGNWSTDPIDAETQVEYDEMLLVVHDIDAHLASVPEAREQVLHGVIQMVRESPEYDAGGIFAEMMDEALAGKVPRLLVSALFLQCGLKPPDSVPDRDALDARRYRYLRFNDKRFNNGMVLGGKALDDFLDAEMACDERNNITWPSDAAIAAAQQEERHG